MVLDPNIGGWKSFLKGEGYFRSQYIYEEIPYHDGLLPLDFVTFMTNPARLRIGVFDRDSGEVKYYTKEDIHGLKDLVKIVRASSSMPVSNREINFNKLSHSYELGYAQGKRDLPRWQEFLGTRSAIADMEQEKSE